MQGITPFLWFDGQAEEAANFYVSIFKNSRIETVVRYGEAGPGPKGSVMIVGFQLEGQRFTALNGGPQFRFTPAISFLVNCDTQDEVDALWDRLSEGGQKQSCGWVMDKFGVSWQVVPVLLGKLMSGADLEKSNRIMKAMLQMDKIDMKRLEEAYRDQ
ncbi:MAG: VOC family protein [Acidobacteria bacterium]|nr:VOC family protein [Acidobacteriota bacterium]